MHEKVLRVALSRQDWRNAGSTAASVNRYPSIVAMSGAIIPEPLMIPAIVTVRSPITAVATAPFGKVSVVPMVAAASSHPHGGAPRAAAIPAWALSLGRGTPITPVEE